MIPQQTPDYLQERKVNRGTLGMQPLPKPKTIRDLNKTKTFTSSTTGKTYTTIDFVNCRSKGVIYLCKCTCPSDYVGKTKRKFKTRLREHICDIKNIHNIPVASHMGETWRWHKMHLFLRSGKKSDHPLEKESGTAIYFRKKPNGSYVLNRPPQIV